MTREQALNYLKSSGFSKEQIQAIVGALGQEPRKGHWIKGYKFPDGEYWRCDKCNELVKVKYPMHYCNNCGSDNREVEK